MQWRNSHSHLGNILSSSSLIFVQICSGVQICCNILQKFAKSWIYPIKHQQIDLSIASYQHIIQLPLNAPLFPGLTIMYYAWTPANYHEIYKDIVESLLNVSLKTCFFMINIHFCYLDCKVVEHVVSGFSTGLEKMGGHFKI